jgi:hypothetical protein
MPEYKKDSEKLNYETFQECLSSSILQAFVEKPSRGRKARISRKRNAECERDNTPKSTPLLSQNDAEELVEFIEVLQLSVARSWAGCSI